MARRSWYRSSSSSRSRSRSDDGYGQWAPYVPVAERQRQARAEVARMKKRGQAACPVAIEGRKIAHTFWGEAWCQNLEAYSDFENRLPRGRTYVRNGSVVDLQVEAGRVRALVSGSSLYRVDIGIAPLPPARWARLKDACAGQIGSLVELLAGSLSKGVMEIVSRKDEGLFPSPKEITLSCSCPDWATMCKHVAASLYGVGARLDDSPALLFTLRGVDPEELVEVALDRAPAASAGAGDSAPTLAEGDLADIFGVDIDLGGGAPAPAAKATRAAKPAPAKAAPAKAATGKRAAKSAPAKKVEKAAPAPAPARVTSKAAPGKRAANSAKAAPAAKATRAAKAAPAAKATRAAKAAPAESAPTKSAPTKSAPTKSAPTKSAPTKSAPAKTPAKAAKASPAKTPAKAAPAPKAAKAAKAPRRAPAPAPRPVPNGLSQPERIQLGALVLAYGVIDNAAVREVTGRSPSEARRLLTDLVAGQVLAVEGQRRGTRYRAGARFQTWLLGL